MLQLSAILGVDLEQAVMTKLAQNRGDAGEAGSAHRRRRIGHEVIPAAAEWCEPRA